MNPELGPRFQRSARAEAASRSLPTLRVPLSWGGARERSRERCTSRELTEKPKETLDGSLGHLAVALAGGVGVLFFRVFRTRRRRRPRRGGAQGGRRREQGGGATLARAFHEPIRGETPVQERLLIDVAVHALKERVKDGAKVDVQRLTIERSTREVGDRSIPRAEEGESWTDPGNSRACEGIPRGGAIRAAHLHDGVDADRVFRERRDRMLLRRALGGDCL